MSTRRHGGVRDDEALTRLAFSWKRWVGLLMEALKSGERLLALCHGTKSPVLVRDGGLVDPVVVVGVELVLAQPGIRVAHDPRS